MSTKGHSVPAMERNAMVNAHAIRHPKKFYIDVSTTYVTGNLIQRKTI